MCKALEIAKFYMKKNADSTPNTYDGNMKLQKLLVFSDMISLVETGEPLFEDDVMAFRHGLVVENVRLRYRNDYYSLKADSEKFDPSFTEQQYDILNKTLRIFGNVSAKELSEISHQFNCWKDNYVSNDYHYRNKKDAIVDIRKYPNDLEKMRQIIDTYKKTSLDNTACEIVNGVKFFYDNMELTDDVLEELIKFSKYADDNAYTVYYDSGELVIS